MTPYKRREDSPKRRSKREESPPRERRSRDDRYERRPSQRSKDSERKDKSSRSYTKQRHQAHVGEWVSGSDSDNHSERSYHSDSEDTQDEGVAGLALVSTNSYDIFDSPNEGIGRCFMAKGPKVTHPEYVDFNNDEDDLLGDDDLLVDNSSYENYDELAINHANQDKTNDNDKEKIEALTKELNTLKLAHETIFENHRELLRAHEKLRFEKLNLEQDHGFLKAINDDLRMKSSSYIAKRLLLSTYMPQVKSSNKNKKDSSSSSNNNHAKSNVVASSSSLDSTNDSLSQVTLEQENSLLKGIIEKGVYKSLAGSKQFEEIVRKQGRHRKNQGVGFERKFNANGVEWEEDQYPKTKFVPQQEKYDPTSLKGTQAQDDLPPQDHKQKDYIKFYFIKYDYNSKDSHQDGVDTKEQELESS